MTSALGNNLSSQRQESQDSIGGFLEALSGVQGRPAELEGWAQLTHLPASPSSTVSWVLMSMFRVCSQMGLVVGSGVLVVTILVFSFLASSELVFLGSGGMAGWRGW